MPKGKTWRNQTPEERKLLNEQRRAKEKIRQQVYHLRRVLKVKSAIIEALINPEPIKR